MGRRGDFGWGEERNPNIVCNPWMLGLKTNHPNLALITKTYMIYNFFLGSVLGSIVESFVDNVIMDTVVPLPGSLVYCDLLKVEHTGIYIGEGLICHLDGNGAIQITTPNDFLSRLNGWNQAISIYVSCRDGNAVGSDEVAKRARLMVGQRRNYNLILDNCHQFSSGCLTGDFENTNNFFWMVKKVASKSLNANGWRVWTTVDGEHVTRMSNPP